MGGLGIENREIKQERERGEIETNRRADRQAVKD